LQLQALHIARISTGTTLPSPHPADFMFNIVLALNVHFSIQYILNIQGNGQMNLEIILGTIIIAGGIGFMTYLVYWSRKAINQISEKNLNSAREIKGNFANGRKTS
jgi:hypothetical protein